MVSTDRTAELRSLVADRADKSQRSKSPDHSRRSRSIGKGKHKQQTPEEIQSEAFLKEAYRIHTHLASLLSLMQTVRRAYLSLQEPPPTSRHTRRADRGGRTGEDGQGSAEQDDELERFRASKYMSDREREEFDLRGRMVLRRCKDRVALLEDEEKARQAKLSLTAPTSLLSTFLPSLSSALASASSSYSQATFAPLITAHRASILWTLNAQLAQASGGLSELQEERSKRRAERGRTLGEGAAKEAAMMSLRKERDALSSVGGQGSIASLFGLPPSSGSSGSKAAAPPPPTGVIPDDEPPIESQLSAAQLQQFESENSTLLSNMQDQLDSVLSAEKSLLEVSALQTELVRNLMTQTELVDRLYDEAVGSVADVGNANVQLRKARERAKDSRLFLLVFLLGASLALLFLDWYS